MIVVSRRTCQMMRLFGLFLCVFSNSSKSYTGWMVSFPVNIKSCQDRAVVTMAAASRSEPALHLWGTTIHIQTDTYLMSPILILHFDIKEHEEKTCLPLWEGHLGRCLTKSVCNVSANSLEDDWGILTYYAGHTNRSVGPRSSNTLHRSRTARMTRSELG